MTNACSLDFGFMEEALYRDLNGQVLIVEDHPMVAAATADLLRKQHPTLRQVVVDSAAAALECASQNWFRVFLDLNVPGASGLSLVRALKQCGLVERCCVITAARDERLVVEAKRLGVLGYIEKSCAVEKFCASLSDIVRGIPVFPEGTVESTVKLPVLTSRQLAILRLLHRGLSSKQVAYELTIAEGTVKNHTLALLRALDASNRAHAVARGIELGLLESVA